MNPSEPTAADIAAVASAVGEPTPTQPAPATPPAEPAPSAPAPAPAPANNNEPPADPFTALFQPTEPTATPTPTPTPPQPTEPNPQPQPPVEPPTEPTPQTKEDYQSFEAYMEEALKNVPKAPETPNPEDISPDDPAAIKKFFDDLVNTAVEKAKSETSRQAAIQAKERILWDECFDTYGSLRTNKNLRDMVHSIRIGYFNRGQAITPKQAAQKLLDSLSTQYRQGVADNQVATTIENVQPTNGGSSAPVTTSQDKKDMLAAVQDGGEAALANILDAQIKAGKL